MPNFSHTWSLFNVVKLNMFSHEETKANLLLISSEAAFCDGMTGSSASEEGVLDMWQVEFLS